MEGFSFGIWDLLFLPVSLPLKAAWTGLDQAVRQAQRLAHRSPALPDELADLQAQYELGEVDEAVYSEAYRRLRQAMDGW